MRTIKGYYGSGNTPCEIFEHEGWYCVEGSVNVNHTWQELALGVNVETVEDDDCFTWGKPIESEEELVQAIEA